MGAGWFNGEVALKKKESKLYTQLLAYRAGCMFEVQMEAYMVLLWLAGWLAGRLADWR